jgi:acetolactate synthase-1/2/3 large subunit
MYTASSAFLEALVEAGVSHLFANFGSDHTALLEAIAAARQAGRPVPSIVTTPFEMVGLAAAQGYAQVSGRPQAVLIHVDCGTQSLAGALHNAMRGRAPVLIFAGLSPATQEGELVGSRNEFIHWLQDVPDQRGIVRQYVKYEQELRTSANVKQLVHRALQISRSDPKGPVYLACGREVLESETRQCAIDSDRWRPTLASGLPCEALQEIVAALAKARRPLVVTSYSGRNPSAVGDLVRFCERLGVGVLESVPQTLNFPHDHPLYLGSQWNEQRQNAVLAEADVILVLDSDVPWIPLVNRPNTRALILHVDVDVLKPSMPLWYIGANRAWQADVGTVLAQLNEFLTGHELDELLVRERSAHYARHHRERTERLVGAESQPASGITPQFLTACVRQELDDPAAIVMNEGITNYSVVADHMARTRPGSYFCSGGSSLGWHGGAAVGAKLAAPDRTVVALTGDGSYMFSVPDSVHWMARRYRAPFLQVIYNNGGWNAPRFSTASVHPNGFASRSEHLDLEFDPAPDYSGVAAAAGGAHACIVRAPEQVRPAIAAALRVVREAGRCAVLDVWLDRN